MVVNHKRIKGRLRDIIDFINNSCKSNDKDILKRNGLYNEITRTIAFGLGPRLPLVICLQ